ncbi:kinase-like protein [Fistulina hepatica ATCC 64428]|nr:kinase-like protein [Fistulina hepatica ATCC 64428]
MLAAATSFFARSAISQSYTLGSGSRPSTPGSSPTPTPRASSQSVVIGLWKVQPATHKVTHKRVSVWTFDKRGPEMERLSPIAKETTLEVLKAEASALSRLRHPSLLEMVEPLEETRSELIFATEPVLASLDLAIPDVGRYASTVELDEIEIQKGILQICKGLAFLHTSAKLIHSHICPESIIINSAGDWKISGLGLTIPLISPGGQPTRWEFPTYDSRAPSYIQRSFDYMAPEYALDEQLVTGSDMYSLGCLIYAVHCKGNSPLKTHGNLASLRESAGRPPPGMDRLDRDLQSLVKSLITRHANGRPTPTTLPAHPFFSNLPISTLNFLDRSNFTAKTREEKISFMKGLTGVLDRFSEGLRTRKILPSLLEEMKDFNLLPYILPNVFAISAALSATQFAMMVLPSLKPLFAIKEPPQNMLTLLDNLTMLQSKTDKQVFREQVLPLVYNALESEHALVQERALKVVPGLCDTIDFAEVQGVLFPRVALVFTKTRILTVKVATLETFLAMVQTLDQTSLTQKMVPLLAKIRTKEPAVMLATLSVHEAMGFKVDREAVATLVLPQLWAMSMGPLLNLSQFLRFMEVIRKLGDRVEKEHQQFLRDSQRLEDRSVTAVNGNASAPFDTSMDFESLVGRANGTTPLAAATNGSTLSPTATGSTSPAKPSWDDDVWGSILNTRSTPTIESPTVVAAIPPTVTQANSFSASSRPQQLPKPSRLGAKPISSTSFNFPSSSPPPPQHRHMSSFVPLRSSLTGERTVSGSYPTTSAVQSPPPPSSGPNYNISLPSIAPAPSVIPSQPAFATSPPSFPSSQPTLPSFMNTPSQLTPSLTPAPSMGSILAPSKPAQPTWTPKKPSKDDWGDFDPLA